MKKDIHPTNYRLVVFEDLNNGFRFLTRSTIKADETTKWDDGNEYPIVKVHISSASHPFFTGQEKLVDIEGRVDKFKARQEAAQAARESRTKAAQKIIDKSKAEAENKSEVQKLGATARPQRPAASKPAHKPAAQAEKAPVEAPAAEATAEA